MRIHFMILLILLRQCIQGTLNEDIVHLYNLRRSAMTCFQRKRFSWHNIDFDMKPSEMKELVSIDWQLTISECRYLAETHCAGASVNVVDKGEHLIEHENFNTHIHIVLKMPLIIHGGQQTHLVILCTPTTPQPGHSSRPSLTSLRILTILPSYLSYQNGNMHSGTVLYLKLML